MGDEIKNKREEEKETGQEIVTAVILKEISKERLTYPDLFKAVQKGLPEGINLKDKKFSKTLGEMSAERLIDSEVVQGYYKWFLITKEKAAI